MAERNWVQEIEENLPDLIAVAKAESGKSDVRELKLRIRELRDEYIRNKKNFRLTVEERHGKQIEFYKKGVKENFSLSESQFKNILETSQEPPESMRRLLNALNEAIIDRTEKCPFLLRIFVKIDEKFQAEEFSGDKFPGTEVDLHVWPDTTLKEITDLLKEYEPKAKERGRSLICSFVYMNRNRYAITEIASVGNLIFSLPIINEFHQDSHFGGSKSAQSTLLDLRFNIGDFMAINIRPNKY